eukprot:gnl/Dysnectes_brevis/1226_a1370_1180.p1 GENE.gnl/Dysnectes_brevis/1226_a1370_1180~~gnl/Dysnectes_brevis/1226_a1370_1180.p1  ORF type:complete len:1015 (+),score=192.02 gnl/Dysnectes_brevis/1226_a1370_1180:1559-4603(+)
MIEACLSLLTDYTTMHDTHMSKTGVVADVFEFLEEPDIPELYPLTRRSFNEIVQDEQMINILSPNLHTDDIHYRSESGYHPLIQSAVPSSPKKTPKQSNPIRKWVGDQTALKQRSKIRTPAPTLYIKEFSPAQCIKQVHNSPLHSIIIRQPHVPTPVIHPPPHRSNPMPPTSQHLRTPKMHIPSSTTPPRLPNAQKTPDSSRQIHPFPQHCFGLPPQALAALNAINIRGLYPWQIELLTATIDTASPLPSRQNIIYTAPTSAGKTLVSMVYIMRTLFLQGCSAVYSMPYVSLVGETAEKFRRLLPSQFPILEVCGTRPLPALSDRPALLVCTQEKAAAVASRFLQEGQLHRLGLIVLDEVHMVGEKDSTRAVKLEAFVTQLRLIQRLGGSEGDPAAQKALLEALATKREAGKPLREPCLRLVAMSATLPNLPDVSRWLGATSYRCTVRPTPLRRILCFGSEMSDLDTGKLLGNVQTKVSMRVPGKDKPVVQTFSPAVSLVLQAHRTTTSVLLFMPSRRLCETATRQLGQATSTLFPIFKDNPLYRRRMRVLEQLKATEYPPPRLLLQAVPFGVSYHHSGLLLEHRQILEEAFLARDLGVIVCTSTLAAGVNLPAGLVVIAAPKVGRSLLDATRYQQMCGRAGRSGLVSEGTAVLCVERRAALLTEVRAKVLSDLPDVRSQLSNPLLSDVAGSTIVLTSLNCFGGTQFVSRVGQIVECTLSAAQGLSGPTLAAATGALTKMTEEGLIDDVPPNLTTLGRATIAAHLEGSTAAQLADRLSNARDYGLVMADDLHIAALALPPCTYDSASHTVQAGSLVAPRWDMLLSQWGIMTKPQRRAAERLGLSEEYLSIRGRVGARTKEGEMGGLFVWNGMLLSEVLAEKPLEQVCSAYRVELGRIQGLMRTASAHALSFSVFCGEMGWWRLATVFNCYVAKFRDGAQDDILELVAIPGVGPRRARLLKSCRITRPEQIVAMGVEGLVQQVDLGKFSSHVAEAIVRGAQRLLAQRNRSQGQGR